MNFNVKGSRSVKLQINLRSTLAKLFLLTFAISRIIFFFNGKVNQNQPHQQHDAILPAEISKTIAKKVEYFVKMHNFLRYSILKTH